MDIEPSAETLPSLTGVCRVHLVRHGTTRLNREHRYRGRRDVPLDAGGWEDAWAAAYQLGPVGIAAVYSSPLRRARDTARVIADECELDLVTDLPGLVNLDYGAWEGLTRDEARAHFPQEYRRYEAYTSDATCPGGESLAVAAERALLSLRVLALLHPGQEVVAVTHAVIVRLIVAGVVEEPHDDWQLALPNGSVSLFEVDADGIRLVNMPAAA